MLDEQGRTLPPVGVPVYWRDRLSEGDAQETVVPGDLIRQHLCPPCRYWDGKVEPGRELS